MRLTILGAAIGALLLAGCASQPRADQAKRFAFGSAAPAGYTPVSTSTTYDAGRGYGFEPGAAQGSYFSVDLPEGSYRVTVTLGDDTQPSTTTIKSELRRLALENVQAAPGQKLERSFIVNVRTPQIPAANGVAPGEVKLNVPRETVSEAWAWDQRLTLEFNGARPAVRTVEITPVQVPTLFLLGDSTVSDQPGEPYNSWGQMLPRFLKPSVAVANYAQSGETYRDSLSKRRLDKILSQMKPGDTLLMQYGHNDQKQIASGKGGPFTTYKAEIKTHVEMVRARGGLPVIVSSMERRRFDPAGKIQLTLTDYAEAARQSARELNVPFIDLHAMSQTMYAALGVEGSKAAFALPAPDRLDNTHHNNYGSYVLAKAIVLGMRQAKLPVASHVVDDFAFDPARPDPVSAFAVPPSPGRKAERPAGDESNREVRVSSTGSAR
ncbi:GDSL-type esterase/lipase family protein [Massilia sp. LC238]|uniref:GDSL-type esterase/lipase family protein n=1 Tax=Massilia sp. LC238 TaxID=1502852 RepID=UPI0004E39CC3|nr:GDSL-type esterase/lipase family protein [Massilia sp. LC238]KFC71441.1 Esterase SGNH hydrolase-type subgroup [Massilia sp. LC238]